MTASVTTVSAVLPPVLTDFLPMDDIPVFGSTEALPPRVGVLWLAGVEAYEDRRAGVAFRYRFPEIEDDADSGEPDVLRVIAERLGGPKPDLRLVKADAYLYDLGLPAVPTDLMSEDMTAIFRYALDEISMLVEQGAYQHFEIMMLELLAMPPHAVEPAWLWAAIRYRQAKKAEGDYDQDRVSHLALRSDGGYINKVRYTYPATLPPSLAYAGFLLFLFEWKHSMDRVLAGRGAIPPAGDPSDEEWARMVTELRGAPLPHPLGFFDQTLAEARQAEVIAHHLHSSEGGPERRLDGHEIHAAVQHEVAHAIFSILEKEMAIEVNFGGIGSFIEGRTLDKRWKGDADVE